MNRLTVAVLIVVSAATIAAVLYGTRPHWPQRDVHDAGGEVVHAIRPESVNAESVATPITERKSPELVEPRQNSTSADEAATRKWVREDATREVRDGYSLLIEQLQLSASEIEALFDFLIEDTIARTKTAYSDGRGLDEDERAARIAEILGDTNTQEFLALETNIREYRELRYIHSMLEEAGVPLTEAQRDGLVTILIDVRKTIDMKLPEHIEPGSIAALEHTLEQLDDYDRLVAELTSSVLTAKQVQLVFERNQTHSYRRAESLAWHKRRRAENPNDDMLPTYPAKRD